MEFEKLLRLMVEKGGSDLFITAGVPPSMKVNGRVMPVTKTPLSPEQTRETVLGVMNEQQRRDFAENHECNFAISARGIGRFRVSAFYQRNLVGMVLRRIETNIPTLEELKLPEILKKLALTKRGLVIFVGATGTGKSTSLAAMIGYRNKNSTGHIISIEDPIEYIHQHQGCIVTQRGGGAGHRLLRGGAEEHPAPGAGRDHDRRGALAGDHGPRRGASPRPATCAWRPCTRTTPTRRWSGSSTSSRPTVSGQVWMDLSLNLKAIVAQQLVPTPDGKGRRAVIEVLLNTPLAADLIRKERGARAEAADEALHRAGHADLRPGAVPALHPGRDHLRGRPGPRRLGQRPAPDDQARFGKRRRPPVEPDPGPEPEITDDDPAGRRFR